MIVEHIPGKLNVLPDALTRYMVHMILQDKGKKSVWSRIGNRVDPIHENLLKGSRHSSCSSGEISSKEDTSSTQGDAYHKPVKNK